MSSLAFAGKITWINEYNVIARCVGPLDIILNVALSRAFWPFSTRTAGHCNQSKLGKVPFPESQAEITK